MNMMKITVSLNIDIADLIADESMETIAEDLENLWLAEKIQNVVRNLLDEHNMRRVKLIVTE